MAKKSAKKMPLPPRIAKMEGKIPVMKPAKKKGNKGAK